MKTISLFIFTTFLLVGCFGGSSDPNHSLEGGFDLDKDFYDLDKKGVERYMDADLNSNPRKTVYSLIGGDGEWHDMVCEISEKIFSPPNDSIVLEVISSIRLRFQGRR